MLTSYETQRQQKAEKGSVMHGNKKKILHRQLVLLHRSSSPFWHFEPVRVRSN